MGFVLAVMLRNVRGSDKYDDDERDGEGEGGELGGRGRTDASSSASRWLVGDHRESRARDERRPSSEIVRPSAVLAISSRSLSEMVLRGKVELRLVAILDCFLESRTLCAFVGTLSVVDIGTEDLRCFSFKLGERAPNLCARILSVSDTLRARTVPDSLRWNQLMIGLLERRDIFFI